ncbi:MAG: DUF4330 domain-containing protein [Candidatus Gastranaerophilales bacterium]|nr:DUF4330 domain-containing protein [Candidatus Gastranaerophilales bacterium]
MNILKKLKPADYIIISVIIILIVILSAVLLKKNNFSNLPIEKEANIQFEVFFRGVSISANEVPFKAGDDAFITIRNVPYTKLKITAMDGRPRMTVLPANNEKGYVIVEDISMPNLYDFIIRLEDKAKKTPDGYVAGGNKIKMGIPVVIEGEKYKYQGTISNVFEVQENNEVKENQNKE